MTTHPAVAVLEYHLTGYRHVWLSTVVNALATPTLFLLGMGVAVGAYVDRAGFLAQPYLQFIAPGMLAVTGLQVAMGEAGSPVLTAFKWQKMYFVMAAAPLRVMDLVLGRLAYIALRVTIASVAFLLVMLVFGTVRSPWAVLMPAVAVLVGLAAAAPMFAYSSSVDSANVMTLVTRLAVLPTLLFSGVFFPLQQLPAVVRAVAEALPLWHGVELARAAALGTATTWPVPAHLAVLGLWLAAGLVLARARFAARLAA